VTTKEAQVGESELPRVAEAIRRAAKNKALAKRRHKLAHFAAQTFKDVGIELHMSGHIVGSDRVRGVSPYGHGSEEGVAVSVLLRIGSQLVSATADLVLDGRGYAGAALVRQIVEVEYLAWAIETRDRDGERWLRSDRRHVNAFSHRESCERPRKGNSEVKTMDTIANWAAILFPKPLYCWMTLSFFPSFCLRIYSVTRAAFGITLSAGAVAVRMVLLF
jgi:hypothetical protein